jgi:hypothetical protein
MNYSDFFKYKKTECLHALAALGFYTGLYVIFFSSVLFSGRLLAPGDISFA